MRSRNKLKIINDPIYGFIHIPSTLVFDIIEHPYFQRLRRINQMALSYLVFPGAKHTRFEHVLGCVFLMQKTVEMLRFKGVQISDKEAEGLYIAILLHDIGHGPFSHAMEHSIVEGISHEEISLCFKALILVSLCTNSFQVSWIWIEPITSNAIASTPELPKEISIQNALFQCLMFVMMN